MITGNRNDAVEFERRRRWKKLEKVKFVYKEKKKLKFVLRNMLKSKRMSSKAKLIVISRKQHFDERDS